MTEAAQEKHQAQGTNISEEHQAQTSLRSTRYPAQTSQRSCQRETQPGLLPAELTCHKHRSSPSTWPICSYLHSQRLLLDNKPTSVSQMATQGFLLQRKFPVRPLFPLHYSSSTDTRCPPSPAGTEQQMCGRPHCTIC